MVDEVEQMSAIRDGVEGQWVWFPGNGWADHEREDAERETKRIEFRNNAIDDYFDLKRQSTAAESRYQALREAAVALDDVYMNQIAFVDRDRESSMSCLDAHDANLLDNAHDALRAALHTEQGGE